MNYKIPPGVITGKKVQEVFNLAKKKSFALIPNDSPYSGILIKKASCKTQNIISFGK